VRWKCCCWLLGGNEARKERARGVEVRVTCARVKRIGFEV
jgi:hypothetical protein